METLRVLTLNIGSVLEARWDERQHEIAAWLLDLTPDVVCLQEVSVSSTRSNRANSHMPSRRCPWRMWW